MPRQEESKFQCHPAPSDTDPWDLERFSINEGTSSDSLLPIVSMMQTTDARE